MGRCFGDLGFGVRGSWGVQAVPITPITYNLIVVTHELVGITRKIVGNLGYK